MIDQTPVLLDLHDLNSRIGGGSLSFFLGTALSIASLGSIYVVGLAKILREQTLSSISKRIAHTRNMRNAATALGGVTFLALTLPATRGVLPLARPLRSLTSSQRSSPSSHGQRSTGTGSAEDREFSCGRSMGACDDLVRTVPVRRRRRRPKSLTMLENADGFSTSAFSCEREASTRCASRAYKAPRGVSLVASSHEVLMDGDTAPCSVSGGAPPSVLGITNLNGLRGTSRNVRWSIERSIPSNMALGTGGKRQRAETNFCASSPSQNIWNSICSPRLTVEEEVALGEDVQRWQRLESLREDGMGVEAWASAAGLSVSDLRRRVERGAGAREKLVLSHVRLVIRLARKRGWATALSEMDLIQEGALALHLAVAKYDPSRGVRFLTYAHWAVRVAVEAAEARQSGSTKLPHYLHVHIRRMKAIILSEMAALGRRPTNKEIAEAMDIEVDYLERLLQWSYNPSSTSELMPSGVSLDEMIPGPESLKVYLERLDAEAVLDRLLRKLSPRETEVILHRFGLFGRERKSVIGIAEGMGLSRQYVNHIQNSALFKMRGSRQGSNKTVRKRMSSRKMSRASKMISPSRETKVLGMETGYGLK